MTIGELDVREGGGLGPLEPFARAPAPTPAPRRRRQPAPQPPPSAPPQEWSFWSPSVGRDLLSRFFTLLPPSWWGDMPKLARDETAAAPVILEETVEIKLKLGTQRHISRQAVPVPTRGQPDAPPEPADGPAAAKLPPERPRARPAPDPPAQCRWSVASLLLRGILSPGGRRLLRLSLRALHWLLCLPLYLGRAVGPLLGLAPGRRPLPPLESPLLTESASRLAALIRAGEVRSEDAVRAYVRRLRQVNPALNAMVQERFEAALEEARAADRRVAEGRRSAQQLSAETPLLGVPFTVKESLAVQGMSHAAGQARLRRRRAAADAVAVQRLRAAGAIPLLVSNCPELCMHYESVNRVTGRTNNPFDLRRTPGGSSGGEAALLGAGASLFSVASDIGGSARLPAMFTGVFGHKPTAGMVPDTGHLPTSDDEDWWRMFTVSPMARYAEDLAPLLRLLVDPPYVGCLRLDQEVDVRRLRVYFMENDGGGLTSDGVDSEMVAGLHRAVEHFSRVCDRLPVQVHLPELKDAFELVALTLFRLEGIESVFQKGDDPRVWKSVCMEWLKYFAGFSDVSFYSLLYGPFKYICSDVPNEILHKYLDKIETLQRRFKDMLGDDGVFLYPTFVSPAVYHNEMYFTFLNGTYLSVFNVLEMPVTNSPVGRARNGMPVGIQIAASRYQDRLSIAAARELERGLGGWQPPPSI